jgi:hypothetical protein
VAEELHEHQGLVNVAHAHAPRDGLAQALVGGGGGWGHGGILDGISGEGRLAGAGWDRGWHLWGRGPGDHPDPRMLPHADQALVDEAKICD